MRKRGWAWRSGATFMALAVALVVAAPELAPAAGAATARAELATKHKQQRHRKKLTAAQKKALLAKYIKAHPGVVAAHQSGHGQTLAQKIGRGTRRRRTPRSTRSGRGQEDQEDEEEGARPVEEVQEQEEKKRRRRRIELRDASLRDLVGRRITRTGGVVPHLLEHPQPAESPGHGPCEEAAEPAQRSSPRPPPIRATPSVADRVLGANCSFERCDPSRIARNITR